MRSDIRRIQSPSAARFSDILRESYRERSRNLPHHRRFSGEWLSCVRQRTPKNNITTGWECQEGISKPANFFTVFPFNPSSLPAAACIMRTVPRLAASFANHKKTAPSNKRAQLVGQAARRVRQNEKEDPVCGPGPAPPKVSANGGLVGAVWGRGAPCGRRAAAAPAARRRNSLGGPPSHALAGSPVQAG